MMRMDEKVMRDEFRRDGFHAVTINFYKDPVNGKVNGVFEL